MAFPAYSVFSRFGRRLPRTSQASAAREPQPAPVPSVGANEQPLPDFPDEDEVIAFEPEPAAAEPAVSDPLVTPELGVPLPVPEEVVAPLDAPLAEPVGSVERRASTFGPASTRIRRFLRAAVNRRRRNAGGAPEDEDRTIGLGHRNSSKDGGRRARSNLDPLDGMARWLQVRVGVAPLARVRHDVEMGRPPICTPSPLSGKFVIVVIVLGAPPA
jgi:hypothetical protein